MSLPESVVILLGKSLAFALLSFSNLEEGKHMQPFAYVQALGDQRVDVQIFDNFAAGEDPGYMVAESRRMVEVFKEKSAAWVFGHESLFQHEEQAGDVTETLVLDIWVRRNPREYTLLQRVRRVPGRQELQLVGAPDIYYGGQVLPREAEADLPGRIQQVTREQLGGGLWDKWNSTAEQP